MRINSDLRVNERDLEDFQEIIGFRFRDTSYLIQALLHGSLFSGDRERLNEFRKVNGLENKDYEKLEYLGDSVLGLIIAEFAYHDHDINEYARSGGFTIEGVSTRIRMMLASNESLKPVAKKIALSRFVISEEHVNIDGRLSDIIEALIGAIYIDGGNGVPQEISCLQDAAYHDNYSIAKDFVYRFFDIHSALERISASNPKGALQELCHKNGLGNPCYKVLREDGPDHEKHFTVGLYLEDELLSSGSGDSKRKAEKDAARKYLNPSGDLHTKSEFNSS